MAEQHFEDTTYISHIRSNGSLACPECGSHRLWKDGFRYVRGKGQAAQRWLCRDCGYRFSEGSEGSKRSERVQNVDRQVLNLPAAYSSNRQVCELLTEGSKNLAAVDTTRQSQQNQVAGATTLDEATIKGKLVEFAFFLKKEGYRPSTIKGKLENVKCLISYGAGPYLLNPEKVKEIIAERSNWGDGYKANVVDAYTSFLTMHRMTWKPPRYSRPETLPWIPLEEELDTLVRTTGKRMSIFLQGLKETGVDPGELNAIRWIDINPQTRTMAINYPVKGHRPRILDVSRELIDRLNTLPKVSERVFQGNPYSIRRNFHDQRQVAARKFNNPRLLEITFVTFRHWKATMEYHKTKDILWVMKLLGHHSLKSTLIYIDLEKATFKETNDEFTVKVADTLDEACKLLEVGFEYVTDMDGKKLFRKRK